MATKQDVRELKDEMQKLEYRLVIKISGIVGVIVTFATGIMAALAKFL